MKPIQLLLIIFCLGIFLIPKDNFYAQASQESCCKAESKKTCCEKKHDDHGSKDNKSDHKSYNDDCCSICVTCNTFLENTFAKNNIWEISSFKTILKIQVQYADPYISNGLKEIWQPPKLG